MSFKFDGLRTFFGHQIECKFSFIYETQLPRNEKYLEFVAVSDWIENQMTKIKSTAKFLIKFFQWAVV